MLRSSMFIVSLAISAAACGGYSPAEPSPGTTSVTNYTVTLLAANEVPAVTNADAGGSGTATITLNVNRDASGSISSATADFQISVTGFPAGTRITDAHIHNAGAGVNAGVFVSVGLTSGELVVTNGGGTISKKGINVPADRAAAILGNPAGHYFNVHTSLNPDGAIRGQLSTASPASSPAFLQ